MLNIDKVLCIIADTKYGKKKETNVLSFILILFLISFMFGNTLLAVHQARVLFEFLQGTQLKFFEILRSRNNSGCYFFKSQSHTVAQAVFIHDFLSASASWDISRPSFLGKRTFFVVYCFCFLRQSLTVCPWLAFIVPPTFAS